MVDGDEQEDNDVTAAEEEEEPIDLCEPCEEEQQQQQQQQAPPLSKPARPSPPVSPHVHLPQQPPPQQQHQSRLGGRPRQQQQQPKLSPVRVDGVCARVRMSTRRRRRASGMQPPQEVQSRGSVHLSLCLARPAAARRRCARCSSSEHEGWQSEGLYQHHHQRGEAARCGW